MSLLRRFLSSTGVCLLLMGAGVCWARPAAAQEEVRPRLVPPHPDVRRRLAAMGHDSVTMVNLARVADVRRSKGIDQAGPIRAPVTGTRPALVLLVEYSDLTANGASTSTFYNNLLFTDGTYPSPGSMRDFYQEVSYGLFDISPTLVDSAWRQTSNAHNYYADWDGTPGTGDDYGFGNYPRNAQGLVVDAVTLADPHVDFSTFAVSGQVQGLFVIHAGRGAETDPTHEDWIWSHQWALNAHAMTVDGVTVNLYSMEPEYSYSAGDSTVGVFCHEYGHVLGLPDLYDYDGSSAGVGDWSLMAGGSWNGPGWDGSSPAHPDAWCRAQLGWVTPTVVTTSVTGASVAQAESNAVAYQLWTNGSIGTEYFLLENRQQVLFDTYLPSNGLLLYHVDETIPDNDNDWHPKVMVEQADGLWDLQYKYDYGDSGDPYPGSTVNRTANASTTPNTRSYAAADTYVSISSISDSAATMTADISVTPPAPAAPTNFRHTAKDKTQINWAWDDNSSDETGFRVDPPALYEAANSTSSSETGLSPNTSYTRHVHAYNTYGDSDPSNDDTTYTYPKDPDVSCDRSTGTPYPVGTVFTFTNLAGWGAGNLDHHHYAWNQSAGYSFTGSEPTWGSGTLPLTGTSAGNWYLHLMTHNPDDEVGGTSTFGAYVAVVQPPVADFSGSPTSGYAPLSVSFTDLSTNTPTSWSWDFGDTGTSTEQNPSHMYTTPNTYTVSLTATNAGGADSETKVDYITATVQPPVADFSGSPTSGYAPLDVSFTDLSTNTPTSWSWDFGDTGTSTVQDPSHTYTTASTYTVSLTATNAGGSDTETKVDYVTATVQPPLADFTGSPTNGYAPLTVDFTDTSLYTPTSWSWDFGDTGSSTEQNPSHIYTTADTYTVSLTATNAGGSDSETKTDYVTVIEGPAELVVLLEVHPNERAQGYGGGPKLGTQCWTSSGLTGPFYLWKVYQFEGSADLWIQVCAQNFNNLQNSSGKGDMLQLKIDGQVPDDVWGIMTGWSGVAQWRGDNEHGDRYTLEFQPTGLSPGQHVLKLAAKETPIIWWIKVTDLEDNVPPE